MRNKLSLDLLSGIGFLAFSLAVGIGAVRLGVGTISDPGPGMYPVILACASAVLSIALAISGLSAASNQASAVLPLEKPKSDWRAAGIAMLALVAYAALLPVFGIAIPSVALLAVLFWVGGLRDLRLHAGLSLLLGIGAEVACRLAGIPVPEAIFWQLF